jgi:hypothetical protein
MTLRALLTGCVMILVSIVPIRAGSPPQTAQMCWAFGRYDRTVYYASIDNREDRSASFLELLEISGIELAGHECVTRPLSTHAEFKEKLVAAWRRSELEVVDTTFLSDLDY